MLSGNKRNTRTQQFSLFSPNSWPENSLKFPGKFLIPFLSFKAYFKKDSVMGEHLSEHVSSTGIFHNNYLNITIQYKRTPCKKYESSITHQLRQGYPVGMYLFKVNNRNTRKRYEICSKLTIKTPVVFIVNYEHISHVVLVFLLLTLSRQMPTGYI